MKKWAGWLAVTAFLVFVIDWGVMGVKLLDGNYDISAEAYIGLISIVVCLSCILYIRFAHRCQHCGKTIPFYGKYCLHCGKEIR